MEFCAVGFATLGAASFDEELELEQRRAACYRTTADRYRATFERDYNAGARAVLSEMIARFEALAREVEASDDRPLQLARDVAEVATEMYPLRAARYGAVWHGQKSRNGVADWPLPQPAPASNSEPLFPKHYSARGSIHVLAH